LFVDITIIIIYHPEGFCIFSLPLIKKRDIFQYDGKYLSADYVLLHSDFIL